MGLEDEGKTMKQHYLKGILLCLCLFTGINASAYDAEINGIYYNLDSETNEAEVTYAGSYRLGLWGYKTEAYIGAMTIPASVTYGGVVYTVTSIGASAFRECTALTAITIPEGVEYIRSSAFYNCSSLESVSIPNSVRIIAAEAFYGCGELSSVSIGSNVMAIGDRAFSGCKKLESVVIPKSVKTLGGGAFSGCKSLKSVTINCEIKSIEAGTFSQCESLVSINIPEGVTIIKEDAFMYCSSLQNLDFPSSLTTIESKAFAWTGLREVIIPNNVTTIQEDAFWNCSAEKIVIGDGIESISERAFTNCRKLKSLYIGKNVKTIEKDAFSYCASLISVTIPDKVETIEESAFEWCAKLKKLTIGSGVKKIGSVAFRYCRVLQDVYCYAENVPSTDSSTFEESQNEFPTLHVPESSISQYSSTSPWSEFFSIVALDNDGGDKKCEKPEIKYENGELKFNCTTEGVEFAYEIKDNDIKSGYGSSVALSATYTINVYAKKTGYEDSEVATATLCWIDVEPQKEGITDEDAVTEVKAMPVLIQTQGSTIIVQGTEEGTPIAIYSVDGKQYGSAIAEKDSTTIFTTLQPRSVAIVKIGEKTVKVMIK